MRKTISNPRKRSEKCAPSTPHPLYCYTRRPPSEVVEKLWDESIRAFVERDILRGKLEKAPPAREIGKGVQLK